MNITQNQLHKWSPILDKLNVTDNNLRNIITEYAEACAISTNYGITSNHGTLLPVAIQVLSKLNLEGKTVEILDNTNTEELELPFNTDTVSVSVLNKDKPFNVYTYQTPYNEDDIIVSDRLDEYGTLLRDGLILGINKQLEKFDTLIIKDLVSKIFYDAKDNKIKLISLIKFK